MSLLLSLAATATLPGPRGTVGGRRLYDNLIAASSCVTQEVKCLAVLAYFVNALPHTPHYLRTVPRLQTVIKTGSAGENDVKSVRVV